MRQPPFEGPEDPCLEYMLQPLLGRPDSGCNKVGLADTKAYNVFHRVSQIKKTAYSRGL